MTGIAHKFTSGKADDADATLVRPTNWNADHDPDLTTKGDIIARDAADAVRLAAGADKTVLGADAAATPGLKYLARSLAAQLADIAAAESAGSDETVPFGDHVHAHPTGLGVNLHHNDLHAAAHKDAGADELDVEELATAGAADSIPKSDGAGAITMIGRSGVAELADVAAAEVAGSDDTVPRGDHVHAHGSGYLANAHHNQGHTLASHSAKAHSDLTGIGAADHHAAAILESLLTTLGDSIYRSSSAPVRVAIGANGKALVADSAETPGVKYEPVLAVLDRDMGQTEVVSSSTETSIYSHSIPANKLGATGGIRVGIRGDYLNNSGAGRTLTVRVKLGATTILTSNTPTITTSTLRRKWMLVIDLFNTATNAQKVGVTFILSAPGSDELVYTDPSTAGRLYEGQGIGSAAEDTTGARTFDVTVRHGTIHASLSLRKEIAFMELLPAT